MAQTNEYGTTYSPRDLRNEALRALEGRLCYAEQPHPLKLRDYGLFLSRGNGHVGLIVHGHCRQHGAVVQLNVAL